MRRVRGVSINPHHILVEGFVRPIPYENDYSPLSSPKLEQQDITPGRYPNQSQRETMGSTQKGAVRLAREMSGAIH